MAWLVTLPAKTQHCGSSGSCPTGWCGSLGEGSKAPKCNADCRLPRDQQTGSRGNHWKLLKRAERHMTCETVNMTQTSLLLSYRLVRVAESESQRVCAVQFASGLADDRRSGSASRKLRDENNKQMVQMTVLSDDVATAQGNFGRTQARGLSCGTIL